MTDTIETPLAEPVDDARARNKAIVFSPTTIFEEKNNDGAFGTFVFDSRRALDPARTQREVRRV